MPFLQRGSKHGDELSIAGSAYTKLPSEEDDDTGLQINDQSRVPPRWHAHCLGGSLVLFLVSLGMFVASLRMASDRRNTCPDSVVARHISAYSPLLDSFTPHWRPQRNITTAQPSAGSLFRQDSNAESDEAWERINDRGFLALTREQVEQMGQEAASVVHVPARELLRVQKEVEEGSGSGGGGAKDATAAVAAAAGDEGEDEEEVLYIGFLDSQHLVHCLAMMRQALVFNYARFYPHGMTSVQHGHLAHCQESLVQSLTCRPSLEVIPATWMENQRFFFSDFDLPRKCLDWDAIMAWQQRHRIDQSGPAAENFTQRFLMPPEGAARRKSGVLNDERLYHTFPRVGEISFL